jgi:hypothetical protein
VPFISTTTIFNLKVTDLPQCCSTFAEGSAGHDSGAGTDIGDYAGVGRNNNETKTKRENWQQKKQQRQQQ